MHSLWIRHVFLESGEELAAGESQILDETADLENDFNDTTTLGGFIADDTTLNETGDGTNWTLGKKNSLQITLNFQS